MKLETGVRLAKWKLTTPRVNSTQLGYLLT